MSTSQNSDNSKSPDSNKEERSELDRLREEQAARWARHVRQTRATVAQNIPHPSEPQTHVSHHVIGVPSVPDNGSTASTQPHRVTRNTIASSPPPTSGHVVSIPINQPQPTSISGETAGEGGEQELSDYELAVRLQQEELQTQYQPAHPTPASPPTTGAVDNRRRQEEEDAAYARRLAQEERSRLRQIEGEDSDDDHLPMTMQDPRLAQPPPMGSFSNDPFVFPPGANLPSGLHEILNLLHTNNNLPPLSTPQGSQPPGLNSLFSFSNTHTPGQGSQFVITSNSPFSQFLGPLQSMFGAPGGNIDHLTYEQLLDLSQRLGQARPRGATEAQIDALPTFTYKAGCLGPEDSTNCTICLEDWKQGDALMRLPCLHVFHQSCSDHWLKINRVCPVCKHPVTENYLPQSDD